MIVSYSHTVAYPFDQALAQAKLQFPLLDLTKVTSAMELDRALLDANEVMYVDADFSKQNDDAIRAEKELADAVESKIGILECPEDGQPVVYTEADLDGAVFCEVPPEFPDPIDPADFDKEMSDLEKELAQIDSLEDDEAKKMVDCIGKMEEITRNINALIQQETLVRETESNLEEFLFNYRVMDVYYAKRLKRLDQILGIFDPLITEKRRLDAEIERLTPIRDNDKARFDELDRVINPKTGTASPVAQPPTKKKGFDFSTATVSAPAPMKTTSNVSQAGEYVPNKNYTQQQLQDWQRAKADFERDDTRLSNLMAELKDTTNRITLEKNKISPFLDTEVTTNNAKYGDAAEAQRQQALNSRIGGVASGFKSVYDRVAEYSSRILMVPNGTDDSFTLEFRHTLVDNAGILAGRPLSYMQSTSDTTVRPVEPDVTPTGILYDQLYNIWSDDDRFFTREERGLTDNPMGIDPSLSGTGAEVHKNSYIGSADKFREFYENFPAKWDEKVAYVKDVIIESALGDLIGNLEMFAIREVEYILAYGQAFQQLPADSAKLGSVIDYIRRSSMSYMGRTDELRRDLSDVQELHKEINRSIAAERGKYTSVPCAVNSAPPEQTEPSGAGADPLGAQSLQGTDPSKPNPTKWCYWVKFSAMATAVNVLPIPGQGGFRYWPVGLTIPSPSGLIKVPLPIIWIPLAVIPMRVGIFVVFIGLCGICPSPFVFYMGPNGEKKFIVSLRPCEEFGSSAEKQLIKTVEKLGIGINTAISKMVNKIDVPGFDPIDSDSRSTLIDDIKDKVLKKVQKIPQLPNTDKLNAMDPSADINEKTSKFKDAVLEYFDKMTVPDLKFPKGGSTVNPKPPPVLEVLNQLKRAFKMDLPQIVVPPTEKINLKEKLISEVQKLDVSKLGISIPNVPAIPNDSTEYMNNVRNAVRKAVKVASDKITPQALGIIAEATEGVTFVNPYQCKGTISGVTIPPVPPLVTAGLGLMVQMFNASIYGMNQGDLNNVPVTPSTFGDLMIAVLSKMPNIEVPNPSKISIKDMMKDSVKKLAKLQLPSLPDATKPPQLRITVPGSLIKGSIRTGVENTLRSFPINDIDLVNISPIDLKQIVVNIVDGSFAPIDGALGPYLDIAAGFKDSKDKGFPETLGLKKVNVDVSKVPVVSKAAMDQAIIAIKALSLIPYPAVAIAPEIFKNLHPVLSSDDLPPWERLSLSNFLFICFLDEWCRQGKVGGGFFENP